MIVMMMMMMNTTTIPLLIVIKEEKEKRCKLIDMTVLSEINTVPPQNLQRSCPGTKVWKLKLLGCGK